jgi:hypothetical protein
VRFSTPCSVPGTLLSTSAVSSFTPKMSCVLSLGLKASERMHHHFHFIQEKKIIFYIYLEGEDS